MGIFDRFPYSSTHEMNLDFMLGKATEIAESLQEVQDGLSDIDTHKAQAEQAAQAAQASQAAASASAGQAAQHVTDAENAADRAETASTEAETAADRAETALGNITNAETVCTEAAEEAKQYAQASQTHSGQAQIYKNAAEAAKNSAELNASQAATSAGSAANSATDAASSARSANVSATNASLHASNAETSATNAATSATNAATSATNAAASANGIQEAADHVESLVKSLPEDFTDLNNTVNQLSDEIVDVKNAIGNVDVSLGKWVLGSVTNTGPEPQTKTRMHYDGMLYFDTGKTATATADNGHEVAWLIFTVLDDYSSLVSSTGWGTEKPVVGDGRYYIPMARRSNSTNMDVETDSPHLHVYYGLNSIPEINNKIDDLNINITDLSEEIQNNEKEAAKDKLYYNDEFSADGLIHRVYNPYKNGGNLVLNGQMHCHSRSESTGKYYDGTDSASATLQAFLSAGYDFMTITDYGNTTGGVTKPNSADIPTGLIWMFDSQEVRAIGGSNYGNKHIPLYNYNTAIPSVSNVSVDAFANQYLDKFAFVSLAHPFYIDTPVSIDELSKINSHVRFVELYNGLCAYLNDNDSTKPYVLPAGKDTDYAFETMLDNGLVTWGLAVSDSHSLSNSFLKKGCIKLFCNSKDRYSILENLWAGNFYCTEWLDTGIESISFNNGVLTINTGDAEATTVFKKEGGVVVKTQTGANVSYQMTGEEKYVRAIVTKANGNRVWTQPIILIKEFDFSNFQFDIK